MKRCLFIPLFILCTSLSFAQGRFSLEGRVLNSSDSSAIEMVAIVIKELNIWSVSDQKGFFILRNVPAGSYNLQVTSLGYEPVEQAIKLTDNLKGIIIHLNQITLAIDEVIVIAKEGKKMGTGSIIQQTALQHVQPTDLSDVLQLLPGQITSNPDLSGPKQLSIREINSRYGQAQLGGKPDAMASIGTLLIIDGAPVSNDANMQFTNSTGLANFATTVAGGNDVRQVSVDNIESVEVIRGIASVENGDMLSGTVKVNLKKGSTPLTTKLKFDPEIKQIYVGKGILLPGGKGSLNADFDFTQSLDDIRYKYKTFNRLNGGIGYSTVFFKTNKPLNLNASIRASQTIDISTKDPDMLDYEKYESKDKSLGLTLSGKWSLNTAILTTINFNVSAKVEHQLGRDIDLKSLNGPMPQPISREAGEHVTDYLPSIYICDLTVDGKPYYLNSKFSGSKSFKIGSIFNNFIIGTDWRQLGNNGLGRIYNPALPPNPTGSSDSRPRSYKDIPAMKELSFYAEENLSAPFGSTKLDIQAGIRFNNIQPKGFFRSEVETTMLDPRFNIKYSILDKKTNKNLKSLVLRFGWGVFSKAPTMLHYYPDKAYFDRVSFNYYDPPNSLLVITTKIFEDTRNYKLKPASNRKFDGGIDFKIRNIDVSVTGFYEKMINSFSFESFYSQNIYNIYESLGQGGLNPYFIEGDGIYYNDLLSGNPVRVNAVQDTIFTDYSYPGNNDQSIKKGIEFTVDFGTVSLLRTSFVLDGAYMNIRKQSVNSYLTQTALSYMGQPFPLVGLYPGGDGTITQRLNSNLRTITHIKELRAIFTITTQIVWFEKYQNIYNDASGNPIIYTKTPVNDIYEDIERIKYVNAIGYYDLNMVYHTFNPLTATIKPYSDLIRAYNDPRYFTPRTYPPTFQINLRLTKEISNRIDFSFYCNNVTNYQPLMKVIGLRETYLRRNQSIYFGAEIKIKI
jgi:hypothetical protein